MQTLSENAKNIIRKMQKDEISEYYIYKAIARRMKPGHNQHVIEKIADEELYHYNLWKDFTGEEIKPNKVKIAFYVFLATVFGYTFALKLMEQGEASASATYSSLVDELPQVKQIIEEEERHEKELLEILDEERLQYVGSMVLGISDALVELTGTLAGLTFALQNNRIVALSGLITGISATLSMAASEFLSARAEGHAKPLKSATYTGVVYFITVLFLVLPYVLLPVDAFALAVTLLLVIVIAIIFLFTYYISVAKGLSFKHRFLEMAGISFSVALISFGIGLLVKKFLNIDI